MSGSLTRAKAATMKQRMNMMTLCEGRRGREGEGEGRKGGGGEKGRGRGEREREGEGRERAVIYKGMSQMGDNLIQGALKSHCSLSQLSWYRV